MPTSYYLFIMIFDIKCIIVICSTSLFVDFILNGFVNLILSSLLMLPVRYNKMIQDLMRAEDDIPSESSGDEAGAKEKANTVVYRTGKRGKK